MRILQIMYLADIGGLQIYVLQLARELKHEGHEVDVCVLYKQGAISDELNAIKIKTYIIGMRFGLDISKAISIISLLRKNHYDIIHVHDRNYLVNVLLLFVRIPKVFTDHGGELISNRPWKRILFYRTLGTQYIRVIANSNYIRTMLMKNNLVNPAKVITVYNGTDVYKSNSTSIVVAEKKASLGIEENRRVIGIIGRIIYVKGIDIFIKTAIEINKVDKSIVYLIIGDGPKRKEYEEMCKRLAGNVDIRFLGWQRDAWKFMEIFDVFLFTSRWEPFGLVLIEAMAMGIPVVGFDTPGANEVVTHNKTALLVKSLDIRKLASEVLALFSNPTLYQKLSNNGKEIARERFSMSKNAKRVAKIYKQSISEWGMGE